MQDQKGRTSLTRFKDDMFQLRETRARHTAGNKLVRVGGGLDKAKKRESR